MIFFGDLYQVQPVQGSLIFEQLIGNKQTIPYDFWQENVKYYELCITMRQTYENCISILNRMRTNTQTEYGLTYLNTNCIIPTPLNPIFPYLFYKNKDVSFHNKKMFSIIPCDVICQNWILIL